MGWLFVGLALFGILCFIGNILNSAITATGEVLKAIAPIVGILLIILVIIAIAKDNKSSEPKVNWIEDTEEVSK